MTFWTVALVAVAVSVDGLWGGFAFGLRRVRIAQQALLLVSGISAGASALAMGAGALLGRAAPTAGARWVSAALLVALGLITMWETYVERRNGNLLVTTRSVPSDAPSLAVEWHEHPLGLLFRILADPTLADADYSGDISLLEAVALGLAVALDASLAAFTIGLTGHVSWFVPAAVGLAHYALVGLGNLMGSRRMVHRFTSRYAYLPGCALVALGLLRLR